ncbi:hypothetical protein EYF80_035173 [Liparis tanakae]|uniref:Uncharacterized protein n=1 Tax=Liparis tanakae TaxID=230148 RepID=A0A4Z2GMZ7_9TELE|nr:hypothetical protein EYF80_035173 [Liparis tanakae]
MSVQRHSFLEVTKQGRCSHKKKLRRLNIHGVNHREDKPLKEGMSGNTALSGGEAETASHRLLGRKEPEEEITAREAGRRLRLFRPLVPSR